VHTRGQGWEVTFYGGAVFNIGGLEGLLYSEYTDDYKKGRQDLRSEQSAPPPQKNAGYAYAMSIYSLFTSPM